jgi:alpha-2-macroglobulin
MKRIKNPVCLFLLYTILFGLFASPARAQTSGLQFELREGAAKLPQKEKVLPPANNAVSLSKPETDAILRRLPPMPTDEKTLQTSFAVRSKTNPPPRTGNVIPIKFPADEQPNAPKITPNNAALSIIRNAPDGKIPLVSDLSVTFSQAMIAVTSQTEAAENVPVILTPQVEGKWRWLGTTTLIFDAATRFPMATKYTATVKAGTKSVNGSALAKDFSWTFLTPPPKVESFYPSNNEYQKATRDQTMQASFNQKIDGKAVIKKISLSADGKQIPVELVDENVSEEEGEQKSIRFRASELLPLDSEIKVIFEKGLPSAEGSLTTDTAQEFSFRTYPPLKFVKSFCSNYYNRETRTECEPSEAFYLEFNNPLFSAPLDASQVIIEPSLENAKISVSNNFIFIEGKKAAQTTYRVTVSPTLKDYYKQTLGSEVSATFKVGLERPRFFAQGGNFVTLDPQTKPKFSVYSRNQPDLNVKIYAVALSDWDAFRQVLATQSYDEKSRKPIPGKVVFEQTVATDGKNDDLTETRIDLSAALTNGFGQLIIFAEPTNKPEKPDYYYQQENKTVIKWIQATNIGLDAFSDNENLVSLATDLKSGKPIANAQISIFGGTSALTDENGFVNLDLPQSLSYSGLLVAKSGDDTAILPELPDYYGTTNWTKRVAYGSLHWSVFDDRGMYRPKEEVEVKGYVRNFTGGKSGDIAEFDGENKTVFYKVKDARSNEIFKGQTKLNGFGAFDFKFRLPDNVNLGRSFVEFRFKENTEYTDYSHYFQVQEFRRPEFEVSVKAETAAPYFVGDSVGFETEAKYYSGGFLANAPANWTVYAASARYMPPNRDDFNFGGFVSWWGDYYGRNYNNSSAQNFEGTTDSDGKHRVTVDLKSANPAYPYTLTANAKVQDVNRQTIADSTALLIHPSAIYVGLRTPKSFVRRGDSFKIETITTDLDGKAIADRDVKIEAVLHNWQRVNNSWQNVEIDTQTCEIKSTETVAACDLTAKAGGVFTITATVLDDRERPNESEIQLWVEGAQTAPQRGVEKEKALLIPDKKEYAPNETAEILVSSPFVPAEGVLTLRRNGIIKTERFTMNESSTVLRVPIEEKYLPNIHAQVDLTGAAERTDDKGVVDKTLPKRPAFASGELNLKISLDSRKLNVTAKPLEETLEPGAETSVNIEVKNNAGEPVADAEVALVAVDEGVLALSNYSIKNPLEDFYTDINAGVFDYHSRQNVLLGNPNDKFDEAKLIESLPVSGRSFESLSLETVNVTSDSSNSFQIDGVPAYKDWKKSDVSYITDQKNSPLKIRQNFNALATFAPSVVTDANGKAVVNFKLPDSLTRYRITAVAGTKSKQFGKTESNITAKKSLQVRPSAPRFMNFGDKIELPVVLQNQTDKPLTIDVAIRAANAALPNIKGKRITVPANDRVEIRFDAAADKAGTARFQIGAVSGSLNDAAQIEIPVWTPATSEAFATYGTTNANGAIVQPISAPKDVFSEFGGLEVTTSSTQLQELTDGYAYVVNYPFGCTEQTASRILAIAALRDVSNAFEVKDLPSKEEIEERITSGIALLQQLQHYDGGFSFWRSDDASFPYVSVHAIHALARADAKGYKVPKEMLAKGKDYLDGIEGKIPENYSQESKWAIRSYAYYVRNLLKDNEADSVISFIKQVTLEKLSPESIGWLLSVLIDDKDIDSIKQVEIIKRHLLNRVTETAGAAHFVTNYTDGEYVLLSSSRRADGVILESLLKAEESDKAANGKYDDDDDEDTPPSARLSVADLNPKIVRGLLANRTKGRWQNTQENVFILLALDKYFHVYEKTTPNFTARIWLGNAYAGQQNFKGRSTDSNLVSVPMDYLQKQKSSPNLILDKQGDGRIYYRIGLNYAPKNLNLKSADYGFIVSRRYEGVDNAEDVKQNAEGSWTIKSGARVRVQLEMIAPTRRYHVALVDKLPAGLEIINSALATSEIVPREEYDYQKPKRSFWFEHQNLRDERAEAFTSLLWEGAWNYSYVARATTPGTFVVPPAKAEEMYAPETFGRSHTDLVRVE